MELRGDDPTISVHLPILDNQAPVPIQPFRWTLLLRSPVPAPRPRGPRAPRGRGRVEAEAREVGPGAGEALGVGRHGEVSAEEEGGVAEGGAERHGRSGERARGWERGWRRGIHGNGMAIAVEAERSEAKRRLLLVRVCGEV